MYNKLNEHFLQMCNSGKLFRSSITGHDLWDMYLTGFNPADTNIFRDPESSEHKCNLCKNFIRRYGNVVTLDDDNNIITLFDIENVAEYTQPFKKLSSTIKAAPLANVFFETYDELNSLPYESCKKTQATFQLGVVKNHKRYTAEEVAKFGGVEEGKTYIFNHFHLSLPKDFVDTSGKSQESIIATYRDAKEVFKRAMDTISLDTLNLVRDLINQGSLLDGQTHLHKIKEIIPLKKVYAAIPDDKKDNWCWKVSYKFPFAKFRNELIGVLCSELSEGEEINKACQNWNKRVDPANYMKAVAPITKRQIEEAKKFVEENGYEESFDRRFANIDDIKVSEILHSNVGDGKLQKVSMFDDVKPTTTRHKRAEFKNVEEVHIDKFMSDILPSCKGIEAFFQSSHEGNMVSLTTANNPDSKPIFKWNNNYSWTFNGNLAGKSLIKETVKSKGGKVDGVLRFSIMWAENNGDNSDLDAHCIEPSGHELYFGNKRCFDTGGNLDIDIIHPKEQMPNGAVENITFPVLEKMPNGAYGFFVHQYSARKSQGFKAEIEFGNESYSYEYNRPVSGYVEVATVHLADGKFTINHALPETAITKEIYGLETNQYHKVNLMCLSPNHWGENAVGNKHYFFMLDKCKTSEDIRSFHNENLIPELAQHRKVLEVLGNTSMISPSNKQLSGLGFNATVRDELIVRISGSHKRVLKIKF